MELHIYLQKLTFTENENVEPCCNQSMSVIVVTWAYVLGKSQNNAHVTTVM